MFTAMANILVNTNLWGVQEMVGKEGGCSRERKRMEVKLESEREFGERVEWKNQTE